MFKLLPPFGPDVAKRVPAADHVATPGGWEPGPQDYKACCQLLCDAFDSRNSFQVGCRRVWHPLPFGPPAGGK